MPKSSDVECSIFFFLLHFSAIDCWGKLKCIERIFQPVDFQMFSIVEREYINKESKHNFLKVWGYWHVNEANYLKKK
jgi:hypothetical protein